MGRRFWLVAGVFVVAFAAAQLIRPDRANPATDASRTIRAHLGNSGAVAVLERACSDCHSNDTIWPRYHAGRARVVADGARRGGGTKGGQLLRVGCLLAGATAGSVGRIVSGRV